MYIVDLNFPYLFLIALGKHRRTWDISWQYLNTDIPSILNNYIRRQLTKEAKHTVHLSNKDTFLLWQATGHEHLLPAAIVRPKSITPVSP